MGRDKLKRTIKFKAIHTHFFAKNKTNQTINLLNEEMEALYLMDSQELYQADAANAMGVSRATFSKIIKSARQKLTMMIINGSNLTIQENNNCKIMITSDDKNEIKNSNIKATYFHIYKIVDKKIISTDIIKNNINSLDDKPAKIIPKIASKHNINFFLSSYIGDGLKNSLLSKGIYTYEINDNISLKQICDLVSK